MFPILDRIIIRDETNATNQTPTRLAVVACDSPLLMVQYNEIDSHQGTLY